MRTTAIILAFVIAIGAIKISTAQGSVVNTAPKASSSKNDATQNKNASVSSSNSQKQKSQQKDTQGHIYVGSNWPSGVIVFRDGAVIDNYSLRYNLLTDKMQYIAGRDTITLTNPQELTTVTFDGHTFIYEQYQSDTIIRQGYFELVVPGKNKLMLKRLVTNQKPDSKYPDDKSLIKYHVDEYYFISKPGIPANKLACNRKSALTFLNDHNEDITEYLRITGNKVRTIEDLKLLVSYYNSLDEEH